MAAEQTHQRKDQVNARTPAVDARPGYDPVNEVELSIGELRERLSRAHALSSRVGSLNIIALQIDAARSRDDIINVLRTDCRFLFDTDIFFVALRNSSRTHYTIHAISEMAHATDLDHKHFPLTQGLAGWVIDHRSPKQVEITAAPWFHEEIEGVLQDLNMEHILAVPLQTSDDTIGALAVSSALPIHDEDVLIAQLLSIHVAVALRNLELFDRAQKGIAQMELVKGIAERLTSKLDLDELLHSAADMIRESFNYFDVTIFMVDAPAEELILVAHAGNYGDFLPQGYRQKMSEGITGWVAREGKRMMVNDVSADQRYLAYEYHSTRSELTVPIRIEGEVVGIVNVEDTKLDAFGETDATVLETLCDQLGSAIKNARLYDEIRKANANLKELDRMKSDFLGIVSHDFRSPLASIILAAKAMLKRNSAMDPKRQSEYLTIIIDQANRLSQLAEDTLSLTKIESGASAYHFKVVNVERLIKDAVALVTISRRHRVECVVDEDVAYIKGDQVRLRQVVQNLVSNAVKYSPKGGLVRVVAEPYSVDQILVTVQDEGIGIPKEQLSKLFQKFSRVDTPEAKEIPGSGLGLWICHEIVRAHGGRILVESEPGKGSAFKLILASTASEAEKTG